MISINIDLTSILDLRQNMEPTIRQALAAAAEDLSKQSYNHLIEEVNKNLHSSRDKYLDALHMDKVSADTTIITLDAKAMWIEEGMEQHSMLEDLLSGPKVKYAKDGSRYVIVPFKHNEKPTSQTQAGRDLADTIKSELKSRKIPYGKIETDQNGQPKLGLLHKIDITRLPNKVSEGPGQGWGPLGQVRQGPTGIPFLQGIRIYQGATGIPLQSGKQVFTKGEANKLGSSHVQKNIMTFRIASSKHMGQGRWEHPGLKARNLMDQTAAWAEELWVSKIAPDIIKRVSQTL